MLSRWQLNVHAIEKVAPKIVPPPVRGPRPRLPVGHHVRPGRAPRLAGRDSGRRRLLRRRGPQRLQKVLAAAGLGSRRQCEELITAGRVEIDRQVVTELGTRVDPAQQAIRVDGVVLSRPKLVYYAVNKPSGVLSTNRDPSGRTRVIDLLPTRDVRLFTIGRLDQYSDGLILVTNDGELANQLTHPRYGVGKTYRVVVAGSPTREVLDKLREGVHLAEGMARAERVEVKSARKESTVLEMVLREGKNREIRRILARVGHKVERLTRIAVGHGAARRLAERRVPQVDSR